MSQARISIRSKAEQVPTRNHRVTKSEQVIKFLLADFGEPNAQMRNLEALMLRLSADAGEAAILSEQDIKILLNAKNRRHPDYFKGVYISGRHDPNHADGRSSQLLSLALNIYNGNQRRTQIVYYSNFKTHYFGFDIQLNTSKELSIFTLDAGVDDCQSKVTDDLLKKLAMLNIPVKAYACRGSFQTDRFNCGFYIYAMLSELAKHQAFHEELKTYPQCLEPPLGKNASCNPYVVVSPVVWVPSSAMPIKIIGMTQSYTRMLKFLSEKLPQEEAEKIVSDYKKKYEDRDKKFYYINNRKQKIADRLKLTMWNACGGINNPLLGMLGERGNTIGLTKKMIITSLMHIDVDKKIPYMIGAVDCFFRSSKLEVNSIQQWEIISNLRAAFIDILIAYKLVNNKAMRLLSCALVDKPLDCLFEFDPNNQEEKNQFRKLVDAITQDNSYQNLLSIYQREQGIREQCLARYKLVKFNMLRKTEVQFSVQGQSHLAKLARLIANLSEEQWAQFLIKYPDADSLKGFKEMAIYLKGVLFGAEENDAQTVTIKRPLEFMPLPPKLNK